MKNFVLGLAYKTRLSTMKSVRKHVGKKVTIVPGHGRPTDIGAIAFAEDYLTETVAQVKKAIKEGKNLNQIQKSISASNFKGYELVEFAHFKINLPSVYNTLMGISDKTRVQ